MSVLAHRIGGMRLPRPLGPQTLPHKSLATLFEQGYRQQPAPRGLIGGGKGYKRIVQH